MDISKEHLGAVQPAEEFPEVTIGEEALEQLVAVDREPAVITNQLLQEAILERKLRTLSKAEVDKLKKEGTEKEPVNLQNVTELSLEFYNILKIDHLWMCTHLTILSLSNNIIERIENLDDLVNLVELNLSFNRISKIKNLTKLVNLERLSLFNNRITKVKNLAALKNLQVLSLGQNQLTDAKFILRYLRMFKNLRSLNLEGNPCEKEVKNFRLAIAGFIPQLVYYNYFIMKKEERQIARQKYSGILKVLESNEEKKEEQAEVERKEQERADYLKRACIDGFERSDFYDYLMENDNEGKTLIKISDRVKEVFHKLKEALNSISKRLFSVGEKQYSIRIEELNRFGKYYKESMVESLTESRALIRDFTNQKTKYLQSIKALYSNTNGEETFIRSSMKKVLLIDKDFTFLRRKTWWLLMEKEMKRYERNENSMAIFETNITEMVNKFIDFVQEEFTRMRDTETEFCDGLSDQINRYIAEFQSKGESPVSLPFFLRSILLNKETLNNHISTSHDNHLILIDNKEEEILEKLRGWLRVLLSDLTQCEINRNRGAVLEIQEFMDHHTQDWAKQMKSYVKDAMAYMTKVEPKWTNEIMRLKMSKKERTIDDKMQMLLKQRTEFDRKERIRRDKIRRQKKQSKEKQAEKDYKSRSEGDSADNETFTFNERKRALNTYKKVFADLDQVINNMTYLDVDKEPYEEKFRDLSVTSCSTPNPTTSALKTISSTTAPIPDTNGEDLTENREMCNRMKKIAQSFKPKHAPALMFKEDEDEDEEDKEPQDDEECWSEGSAVLVEDELDIEAFQIEVTRNVSRFINNTRIRADHMADTIWELWSSPEPHAIPDSDESEDSL